MDYARQNMGERECFINFFGSWTLKSPEQKSNFDSSSSVRREDGAATFFAPNSVAAYSQQILTSTLESKKNRRVKSILYQYVFQTNVYQLHP